MAVKENPGALGGATGAGIAFKANAAGTPNVAQGKGCAKRVGLYHITPEGGEAFMIEITGRNAWATDQLRTAALKICTPFNEPVPRWSAYVFNLCALGVPIEAVTEPHGGAYAGNHGPTCAARPRGERQWCMNCLQNLYLRRPHGLTEAQTQAVAALIWEVN